MIGQGPATPAPPQPQAAEFYRHSIKVLDDAGVPFVVGGGYALAYHTGVIRHTKDFDVFIRRSDLERTLSAFEQAGYRTERTWPHFLAKALHGEFFVDVLYSSANGVCPVDDEWFTNAREGNILGERALVCPAEEVIWQKAYIQDRDRYDGADIAHLLLARGQDLDWHRLMRRMAGHERLLLSHVILFGFIYPGHRDRVPAWVMPELLKRIESEPSAAVAESCRGTFLSKDQYQFDVRNWGFDDPRLRPHGPLTPTDVASLTAA